MWLTLLGGDSLDFLAAEVPFLADEASDIGGFSSEVENYEDVESLEVPREPDPQMQVT